MKPKIFVSSTVYDFRDLRSALKFHLENLGFEVLLSEYNDFRKKLDLNSYQACLESIENVEYFILLIGSRTGGYYNLKDKISITQKEYQTAYNVASSKGIKILTFVRDAIWTIKEDRKALEVCLLNDLSKAKEVPKNELKKIANYSSSIINDAEFIFNFLDEVSRKSEMKKAVKDGDDFPNNNWVHPFKSFNDIIDVLKLEFNIKNTLFEESIKFSLKSELLEIIKNLLSKTNGKITKQNLWGFFGRQNINKGLDKPSQMKYQHFKWLMAYAMVGVGTSTYMRIHFITKTIESGLFLIYNIGSAGYENSLISQSLQNLQDKIEKLKNAEAICSKNSIQFIQKYHHLNGYPDQYIVEIDNIDILPYLFTFDIQEDILNLASGIYCALEGDNSVLSKVKLSPSTPFEVENEKMKYEKLSEEEIISWLKDL